MEKLTTKVIIPGRLSYAHVWEPNEDGKYSTALIIENDEQLVAKIETAIKNAMIEGKNKLAGKNGKIPPNLKTPLRNADEEGIDDPNYVGKLFLNATSKNRPGIVDRRKNRIDDPEEVYSGCFCNVSINFYAFAVEGNKGIAAGLNNIQKVRDGERLSGGSSPDSDFDDLGEDEDSIFDDAV